MSSQLPAFKPANRRGVYEFAIVDAQRTQGASILALAAEHDAKPVGLGIEIRERTLPVMSIGGLGLDITVFRAALFSLGESSDHLLQAWARLWNFDRTQLTFCDRVEVDVVLLSGQLFAQSAAPTRLKLFGRQVDCFELLLDIDFHTQQARLLEKDADYRNALLRGLSDPLPPSA